MEEKKTKLAFYDLQVSPYSFDFLQFVIAARAADCTKFVIVPGNRAYQKCTPEEQMERLERILVGLMPSAIVCNTRGEASRMWHEGCFPHGYTVERPVAAHRIKDVLAGMKITPFAPTAEKKSEVLSDGYCGPNLAVITIRDTHIKSARNSTLSEWVRAADWLTSQGFDVVFVPDTEKPDAVFGEHRSCSKAALDVQYRLALYEAACVNLGVNNGPMALNLFSRRPMLYFRPLNPSFPETSLDGWRAHGLPFKTQPPWFTPLQRIVWEGHDDFENIKTWVELWMRARKGENPWPHAVAPTFPIRGVMDSALRAAQMTQAMAAAKERGWQVMKRVPAHERWLSLVCYGPSLKDTWRFIPRPILTVSGAHDFLIERGIVPDFHMDCDPREHKTKMLNAPHPDTQYLMASVCHPSTWEKLRAHKVRLWHLHNGAETDVWLRENDPANAPLGGGTTAGSRALQVGSLMGYERFHIFGMDCSYETEAKRHAGAHLGNQQKAMQVLTGDGREFLSSPQMVEAAREMLEMIQAYEIWVRFHGDGLQQHMVRGYKARFGVIEARDEKPIHLITKEATHG